MKRYDSYKDSGVEWIGEIPVNWENLKLEFIDYVEKEDKTSDESE